MMAMTSRVEIVTPRKRFFFKKEGCAGRVAVVILAVAPCFTYMNVNFKSGIFDRRGAENAEKIF